MPRAWLICCAVGLWPTAWADPVTFADAVARASVDAPLVVARRAGLEAAQLSIKPAGELPDPQLALGVENLPVTGADQFSLNRDFMTMKSVGLMQEVPSRDKRLARSGVAQAEFGAARAALDISRLDARLGAARAWIAAFYAVAEEGLLTQLGEELATISTASSAALSAGSGSADAALSAQIERSRIDDRLSDVRSRIRSARAELERWIGPLGQEAVGPASPSFQIDPAMLRQHLEHHVAVAASTAEIGRARAGVDLARADRKSDWSWELMYESREPAFSDMISFGVRFKLPLFQSTRQTPAIESKRAELRRAEADRESILRQHRAHLEDMLASHAAAAERLQRVVDVQLPLARQRESVAEAAYAAGTISATDLISTRIARVEMELERLAVERQVTMLGATLVLEHGEPMP
jgi:outer membrane protein TolC